MSSHLREASHSHPLRQLNNGLGVVAEFGKKSANEELFNCWPVCSFWMSGGQKSLQGLNGPHLVIMCLILSLLHLLLRKLHAQITT